MTPLRAYALAVAACLATALFAGPLTAWVDPVNLVMLFLLVVFLVALRLGRGPALLAAFLNVALFDFFFIPPQLTFAVADAQHLITFAVMLLVALVTGQLTARLGQQAEETRVRERRTRALYELARDLAGALTLDQVAEATRARLRQAVRVEGTLLMPDTQGSWRGVGEAGGFPGDAGLLARVYDRGTAIEKLGLSGSGEAVLFLPMSAPMRVRGVLEVHADVEALRETRPWLEAAANLAGIAAERLHYVDVAQTTQMNMEAERLRNTVLASLSHDLRTPLTSLVGLADTLVAARLPAPHGETAAIVRDQAAALANMVANLLDLARLAAGGGMKPRKDWQSLEETVGAAIKQLGTTLEGRPVGIDLPADLPLIEFDAVLMERVLANLIENAAKHAPPGTAIRIAARPLVGRVEVAVSNAGPGFPGGLDLTMPFARGGLRPGSGLGLAIARAIVEAHGGTLRLENPTEGGARVVFELPAGQQPGFDEEPE